MTRLRIGAVPYLNARPITAGLATRHDVEYSEHVPSRLAAMLARGELDCALVSSIEAARIQGSVIVDAPCIASDGPVDSVRLFGARDPKTARSVALDGASRTSVALAKLTYSRFLGRPDVEFRDVGPAPDPRATGADATLVIGDAALRITALSQFASLDLGAIWTASTGLPFVWAVWLERPELDANDSRALETLLRAARLDREGIARAAREWSERLGVPESVTLPYLSRTIGYEFGTREREGLAEFLRLAAT